MLVDPQLNSCRYIAGQDSVKSNRLASAVLYMILLQWQYALLGFRALAVMLLASCNTVNALMSCLFAFSTSR